ncbi:sphingomyelin phosphodiesterase [Hypoxylon trugodes]|uniref:sphingomyelin phosphodiesterase n=1 Tax=Hypoxylon trugodes TaxID=326681 RepID=UPI002193855A|nr:sphingomyelin phosphodiesterase [Hypoxylon trugodes]KAI1391367.1 sphingomyelin phosphodiesterase [Hypoxylon trugodes]
MRVLSFILAALAGATVGVVGAADDPQKVLSSGTTKGFMGGLGLDALVTSTREDAQSPLSCGGCEAVLLQLKLLASQGDGFFVSVTTALCKRAGIQDPDVCEGTIALEGPIIAHGLRGLVLGSRTSRLACVAFMGLCAHPEVAPHNVSFPSPGDGHGRPLPSNLDPIYVVHFSDIHVDPQYVVGANANCSKPICCREYTDSDKPGQNDFPAGFNGEHTCDAPVTLEESMYAAIKKIVPHVYFSIFTGDIVDHAVWDTSRAQNTFGIADAYGRMSAAGLNPVYGTAGNHEASPANSFPPVAEDGSGSDGDSNTSQWLYDLLASAWSQWIGPSAADTTRQFGGYSARFTNYKIGYGKLSTGKLRVISLSTNMYYAHNYWLYEEPMQKDPSGQLAWLVGELDAAEKAGEAVYIIGHMPLGSRDAFHDGSNYLDQIVKRYSGTIAAMFFGHTHFDEFELSYADYNNKSHANALVTSYIAPSMTPTSGHPAFRVYTVDPVNFAVLDATTYIANTSDPSFHTSGPKWTKYYSAREAYGPLVGLDLSSGRVPKDFQVQDLSPAFWHNVTEVLERNATAFNEYFARRRRGWNVDECDEQCRKAEICKLRAARAQDNCIPPGLKFDRLAEGGEAGVLLDEEDECGESIIRDTLGMLVRDVDMLRMFEEIVVEKGLL